LVVELQRFAFAGALALALMALALAAPTTTLTLGLELIPGLALVTAVGRALPRVHGTRPLVTAVDFADFAVGLPTPNLALFGSGLGLMAVILVFGLAAGAAAAPALLLATPVLETGFLTTGCISFAAFTLLSFVSMLWSARHKNTPQNYRHSLSADKADHSVCIQVQ